MERFRAQIDGELSGVFVRPWLRRRLLALARRMPWRGRLHRVRPPRGSRRVRR